MNSEHLLWILFCLIFVVVSAVDYRVTSHRTKPISVKEALYWTGLWISLALLFGVAILFLHPHGKALTPLYIAGYLTEYSLSIDNLFVFILIFQLMGVIEAAQPKLIKLGIYLSIALRVLFILFGITLLNCFHWLIYGFGALLIWTAWKMIASGEEDQVHPENNLLARTASRIFPLHKDPQENKRLFVTLDGRRCITPLFLVFLVIGSTDVLFAIDSIPAIMGISQDPFVVLTSNIFAVLGLNALFFAIRGVMGLFKFLKHGVSIILFFIGAKMLAAVYGPIDEWFKAHSSASLIVIVVVLTGSILLSILDDRRQAGGPADKE